MVADSRSDRNATTHRTTATRNRTRDRAALARQPAPWPELIKKRSVVQVPAGREFESLRARTGQRPVPIDSGSMPSAVKRVARSSTHSGGVRWSASAVWVYRVRDFEQGRPWHPPGDQEQRVGAGGDDLRQVRDRGCCCERGQDADLIRQTERGGVRPGEFRDKPVTEGHTG